MDRNKHLLQQTKQQYKADIRFAHPAIIKVLNKTNPKNKQYFYLHKKLKQVNSKENIKIKNKTVSLPKNRKLIIINNSAFKVSHIEKKTFGFTNIIKPYTKKYRLWLAIKYIESN